MSKINTVTLSGAMYCVYVYLLVLQSKEPVKIRGDIVGEGSEDDWVSYEPEKHRYLCSGLQGCREALFCLEERGQQVFSSKPTPQDYKQFKSSCHTHIQEARKILDKHRGWTKILLNIVAFILTAGVGYAIAAGLNLYKIKENLPYLIRIHP